MFKTKSGTEFKVALFSVLALAGIILITRELMAVGTYAEGRKIVQLIQFDSRGLVYESYEAIAAVAGFNDDEKCDRRRYQCYRPLRKTIKFSVRPETARVVNFMRKNKGRMMLIEYKIHRIEPLGLETSTEVLRVWTQGAQVPTGFLRRKVVRKTGSRNFDVRGKILALEYRGTAIGTYEGLFLDMNRRKVHPFSVTDKEMAEYAMDTMLYKTPFHMGISVARITGARESDHDIFEINYDEESGGLVEKPVKKK